MNHPFWIVWSDNWGDVGCCSLFGIQMNLLEIFGGSKLHVAGIFVVWGKCVCRGILLFLSERLIYYVILMIHCLFLLLLLLLLLFGV